ncbi:hypothetical protein [Tissierella creatinophila]|uniref:Uncharacterized protein n=1 Tax=Tissierella creatinophila DSM 6911 TaxID=1123403 RepID=A0A1U7M4T0_TISCR|nr:hypothetical protein [Tissierella creatinophila]OLS02260.1 hypothetical protein TICRE_16460 [Tissierella creatinophila DSM 6911]
MEKTALRLTGTPKAGTTTVMLISPTTGKSASSSIVVAEAQRADKITFEVPGLAVANEALFVPVTVLDKEGNAITNLDVLNDSTRGIKVNGGTTLISKDSKGIIGFSAGTPSEAGYVSLVGLSSTAKSEIVNIQVKEAAKPTVVRGLAKDVSAVLLADKNLAKGDLVVEDQYGRAMTSTTGTALTLAANAGSNGYRIAVTDNATNTVIANGGTTKYIYNEGNITLNRGTNGAEKVEFAIEEKKAGGNWTLIAGSSQEIEFRVTDGTEYASYEVEEVGRLLDYNNDDNANTTVTGYDKELKVYGVLDDGKKVQLDTSKYTVTNSSNLTYTKATNKINVVNALANTTYDEKATEQKGTLVVTINATGKQLTQEVTISKVAPKVTEFKMVAEGTTAPANKEAYDKLTELTTVDATENNFFTPAKAANTVVDFIAIDSYGVISKVDTGEAGTLKEFKLVGTPAVAHTVTLTNQNAYNLAIAGLEKDEIVTVTATVDGLSKSFKVKGIVDSVANVATAISQVNTAVNNLAVNNTTIQTNVQSAVDGTALITSDANLTGIVSNFVKVDATPGVAGKITFDVTISKGSASQVVSYVKVIAAL